MAAANMVAWTKNTLNYFSLAAAIPLVFTFRTQSGTNESAARHFEIRLNCLIGSCQLECVGRISYCVVCESQEMV